MHLATLRRGHGHSRPNAGRAPPSYASAAFFAAVQARCSSRLRTPSLPEAEMGCLRARFLPYTYMRMAEPSSAQVCSTANIVCRDDCVSTMMNDEN